MGQLRGQTVAVAFMAMAGLLASCATPVPPATGQSPRTQPPQQSTATTGQALPPAKTTTPAAGSVSGRQLSARLSSALRAQRGFHLTASEGAGGKGFHCDVQFASNGGVGTLTATGMQFHILSVGSDLFMSASDAQWRRSFQYGNNAPAKLAAVSGKYVQFHASSPGQSINPLAELAGWANRDALIRMFFGASGIGATNFIDRGTTSFAGMAVTRYEAPGSGADPGFELDVAATGPPLPIHIATPPSSALAVSIDFTNYGEPAVISRPPASQIVQESAIYPAAAP